MSCCGGNCGCASSSKSGKGCGGCKKYLDTDMGCPEKSTSGTLIEKKSEFEKGSEKNMAAEKGGGKCKHCGPLCTCHPCNCEM